MSVITAVARQLEFSKTYRLKGSFKGSESDLLLMNLTNSANALFLILDELKLGELIDRYIDISHETGLAAWNIEVRRIIRTTRVANAIMLNSQNYGSHDSLCALLDLLTFSSGDEKKLFSDTPVIISIKSMSMADVSELYTIGFDKPERDSTYMFSTVGQVLVSQMKKLVKVSQEAPIIETISAKEKARKTWGMKL